MNVIRAEASRRQLETTKHKIVRAAVHLFASQGVQGVSLRQIAMEAGQKNTNAVRYHFSDRDGLIRAIFEYYSCKFEEIRGKMLKTAIENSRIHDIKTLMEILLLPYVMVKDEDGRHSYAGFMSQYMIQSKRHEFNYPFDKSGEKVPNLIHVLNAINDRLGFLPKAILQYRIRTMVRMFSSSIVRWDNDNISNSSTISLDVLIVDIMSQISAAIAAPFRYQKQDLFVEYMG